MHLLEQLIRQMSYEGLGALLEDGGALCFGVMPPEPGHVICVIARDVRTPGDPDGAMVQVLVRGGEGVMMALGPAQAVADAMDGWSGYLCGSGYRADIELVNGPADIGPDKSGRHLYAMNFCVRYC